MRLSLWRRKRNTSRDQIDFCESCGQVCDAACRSAAAFDRAQVRMLHYRAGLP